MNTIYLKATYKYDNSTCYYKAQETKSGWGFCRYTENGEKIFHFNGYYLTLTELLTSVSNYRDSYKFEFFLELPIEKCSHCNGTGKVSINV
jgi:hypothetical protein